MKIKPIGERVLVKPVKTKEKTEGGIYIPEEAKEEKKQAIIEEVGTKKDNEELPLKKGDKILYGGFSSEEFELDDEKYLIIDLKDVLAVLED